MKLFTASLLFTAGTLGAFAGDIADEFSLIPRPTAAERIAGAGQFTLTPETVIVAENDTLPVAKILVEEFFGATGFRLAVESKAGNAKSAVYLRIKKTEGVSAEDESYKLRIADGDVEIVAPNYAGVFNGTRTLLQLFPPDIFQKNPSLMPRFTKEDLTLPALKIEDGPTFPWRGMMLDVARYFFNKEFVLRYIDIMAAHKLNMLHFHCTDDSGWRIEIKKYPKLTTVGGFAGEGALRKGGFYTQDEIREIVAYAAARNVTIVPEIELPAHSLAAIAAYPELGCTGKQHTVPTIHFISDDLLCAGKESTWKFLHDVFDEVCELFPSKTIHIGGDETKFSKWKKCPDCQAKIKELGLKNEFALQGWMTTEAEKYLKTKGRIILGWDEILRAGVSPTAAIMPWHDKKAAADGAKAGHPVVMALTRHTYIDTTETRGPGEPPGAMWLPAVSLADAYEWNPMPDGLSPEQQKNILGAQGCLWSDQFLHKPAQLANVSVFNETRAENYMEYLLMPRAAALAEVVWTPVEKRNFENLKSRLARQYARYAAAGWQYRLPEPTVKFAKDSAGKITATATAGAEGATIRHTTDGSWPLPNSPLYTAPVTVEKESDFRAIAVAREGGRVSLPFTVKESDNKFTKFGTKFGEWKSGKVGNRKPLIVEFDATGKIDRVGTYEITFVYTSGAQRLDIDSVEVFLNQDSVAKDVHRGFTGGQSKNNTYTLKVNRYETGAAFKVRAAIYGDEGNDSNGVVLIRRK